MAGRHPSKVQVAGSIPACHSMREGTSRRVIGVRRPLVSRKHAGCLQRSGFNSLAGTGRAVT